MVLCGSFHLSFAYQTSQTCEVKVCLTQVGQGPLTCSSPLAGLQLYDTESRWERGRQQKPHFRMIASTSNANDKRLPGQNISTTYQYMSRMEIRPSGLFQADCTSQARLKAGVRLFRRYLFRGLPILVGCFSKNRGPPTRGVPAGFPLSL